LRPALPGRWRERAVGEEPAARLAPRAAVLLVLGVDDALHRGAARRARLAVAPVDGHPFAERRDPLGELRTGLPPQPFAPVEQRRARGLEEARALRVRELPRELHGRQARPMKDLGGVGVADPAEEPWVGERTLERVVLRDE